MAIKQIALAFREYFTGWLNTVGLELDNLVGQMNAVTRGIGTWTSVSFVAASFSGSGSMTWTVNAGQVTTFEYALFGNAGNFGGQTMLVHLHALGTTVGGTLNTQLKVLVPAGATVQNTCSGSFHYQDNGTFSTGVWEAAANGTSVSFYKSDRTNWQASTAKTDIRATLALSVK